MREIYGFLRLASRFAIPFGHFSQVCAQVLVLQTYVDLRRLASPFGQGLRRTVGAGPERDRLGESLLYFYILAILFICLSVFVVAENRKEERS